MLQKRIIPCLLINDHSLIKTIKFKNYRYIGNPSNTIRIFNELEVDEIVLLDIFASSLNNEPDYEIIEEVSSECFMPLTYGGGIKTVDEVKKILSIGVEKVVINSSAISNKLFIKDLAKNFGSQCIVGSIDIRKNIFGKYVVFSKNGTQRSPINPVEWALEMEDQGVGELLVTSIDRDGTWSGYDTELIKIIMDNVSIPVIANGGAGSLIDIDKLFKKTSCSAAAASSLFVYQKKGMGVLINFPEIKDYIDIIK